MQSIYSAYLLWAFVKFCVYPSFPFGIEGRICLLWVRIILIILLRVGYLKYGLGLINS